MLFLSNRSEKVNLSEITSKCVLIWSHVKQWLWISKWSKLQWFKCDLVIISDQWIYFKNLLNLMCTTCIWVIICQLQSYFFSWSPRLNGLFTIVVLRYCINNSRICPFWTCWWAALSTISLRALFSLCYASNCNWNAFLDKHVHDNIKSL